ncbi:MAG: DUF1731 domain-containing protein [Candidatus Peribacteria bacterium]|nr:MAG: DUF1731 domain-containing protein [Candidatus Peribacteria bacterium]
MSWISVEDLVSLLTTAVYDNSYTGIVHAVTPTPVMRKEFNELLRKHRQIHLSCKLPESVVKMLFGEQAELFLGSRNIEPTVLLKHNFVYQHTDIQFYLEGLEN